jgi:hypothetical protein
MGKQPVAKCLTAGRDAGSSCGSGVRLLALDQVALQQGGLPLEEVVPAALRFKLKVDK